MPHAKLGLISAYTQADIVGLNKLHRYLKVKDPLTGQWQYFWKLRNPYSSASAGKHWELTLTRFLTSEAAGLK